MSAESSSLKPGLILTTLWAVIAFAGSQFVVALVASKFFGWNGEGNASFFVVQGVAQLVCLATLYKILTLYDLNFKKIGLTGNPLRHAGLIGLIYLAYLGTSAIFTSAAGVLFNVDLERAQNIGFVAPQGIELVYVFVALVVVTPFVEEVIFRGFLYRAYGRTFGPLLGALLVSLLFAMVHGQVNVGLDVFVMSLAACYLRHKTDSLWPPIMLHTLKNFIAFIALFAFSTG